MNCKKITKNYIFELAKFKDSIAKNIEPFFVARCGRSLLWNYPVGGAKVQAEKKSNKLQLQI